MFTLSNDELILQTYELMVIESMVTYTDGCSLKILIMLLFPLYSRVESLNLMLDS